MDQQLITIENIQSYLDRYPGKGICMGSDYAIFQVRLDELSDFQPAPLPFIRFAGLMLIVLRKGELRITIDDRSFSAFAGSMFSIPPNIGSIISTSDPAETSMTLVYMSREFLQTLNLSLATFSGPVILEHSSPVCNMQRDDAETLDRYISLLETVARKADYPAIARQCASSLCVSLFYNCLRMFMRQLELSNEAFMGLRANHNHSRGTHVRNFIRLVHAEFSRERSVAYYASRLCMSPKYLSALVREATGRTAARWIDDYVVMEAKNLLLYSGKNVQQVAYALNFPNQSAFGKYFKHLTGMSPTEFQKS